MRWLYALAAVLASCGPTSSPPECGPGSHPAWYCSPPGVGHEPGCHWDCDPGDVAQ